MMGRQLDDISVKAEIAEVVENHKEIEYNIHKACIDAGRQPQDVQLLGVTKTVTAHRINAAIAAGLHQIGENRVQEFLGKKDSLDLKGVRVHLIGHLQTNKVRSIVGQVDMIESVDSLRVAQAIHRESKKAGLVTNVLVEVNIGREQTKSGVMVEELEELLSQMGGMDGLKVGGLMTIPPIYDKESEKRAAFSSMYKLFVDIQGKNIDNISMDVLSMGMSSDYREAILEGATIVRVGSALFGKRQ